MGYDPETGPYDDGPEEEEEPMTIPRDSFEVKGPYRWDSKKWLYEILEDGEHIADVVHKDQQQALERALLLAAAPHLADVMKMVHDIVNADWVTIKAAFEKAGVQLPFQPYILKQMVEAWFQSQGLKCEACETLGQPCRMVYSPNGRIYHPMCLPEDVKKEIAKEREAAACDDVTF